MRITAAASATSSKAVNPMALEVYALYTPPMSDHTDRKLCINMFGCKFVLRKSLLHSFLKFLRQVFLPVLLHPTRAGYSNCWFESLLFCLYFSFESRLYWNIDLAW